MFEARFYEKPKPCRGCGGVNHCECWDKAYADTAKEEKIYTLCQKCGCDVLQGYSMAIDDEFNNVCPDCYRDALLEPERLQYD